MARRRGGSGLGWTAEAENSGVASMGDAVPTSQGAEAPTPVGTISVSCPSGLETSCVPTNLVGVRWRNGRTQQPPQPEPSCRGKDADLRDPFPDLGWVEPSWRPQFRMQ